MTDNPHPTVGKLSPYRAGLQARVVCELMIGSSSLNAAACIVWLRRFTLSLLKQHTRKDSLEMKRRLCGWHDSVLMQVLAGNAL